MDVRAGVAQHPFGGTEEPAAQLDPGLGEHGVEVEEQRAEDLESLPVVAPAERVQESRRRAGTERYRECVDRTYQRGGVGRAQLACRHESGSGRITLLTARLALFTRSSTAVSESERLGGGLQVLADRLGLDLALLGRARQQLDRAAHDAIELSRTGNLAHDVERDVGERGCVPDDLAEDRGLPVGDLQHVSHLALGLVRDAHRVTYEPRDRRVLGRLDERAHLAQRVADDLLLVGVRAAAHLGAYELLELRGQRDFHGAPGPSRLDRQDGAQTDAGRHVGEGLVDLGRAGAGR